ncbi:MAG TPA: hypothetical protein VGB50_13550 [Flavobacterium sp.]|jgi:hypothetical protein
MKTLILLLLLSFGVSAQSYIQKLDGTKISVEKGMIKPVIGSNKLVYRLEGQEKKKSVKFRDLDFASFDGYFFRTVQIKNKRRGYYIVTDMHGKSLAVSVKSRTKYVGGFNSYYNQYELLVLNSGNVVQKISFTNSDREDNPALRTQAMQMIRSEFSQCSKVLAMLNAASGSDKQNGEILVFIENRRFIDCN